MKTLALPLILLASAHVSHATPRCATEAEAPHVVHVHLLNLSRMTDAALASMLDTANRVWRPYGVTVEPGTDTDAVVVEVLGTVRASTTEIGVGTLGETLFSEGHARPYIRLWLGTAEALTDGVDPTLPPFRTRNVAERDGMLARMLGIGLAHELAHYLLDTRQHASSGVFRARLDLRSLEDAKDARLKLTSEQQCLICTRGISECAR